MSPSPRVLLVAVATAAVLGACAPSPTTTVTDPSGRSVTVDWQDYPGHAWVDAEEAWAAPSQAAAERTGTQLLADVEQALTDRYGWLWGTRTEAVWSPDGENGYGGQSSYVTYNSDLRESDDLPGEPSVWSDVVAVVSEVTADHGLGPVVLEHDRLRQQGDEEALRALHEERGTDHPDELWVWNGMAEHGTQWFWVDLTDVGRHPDPDEVREHERIGLPRRSIRLTYGVTTVADDERPTFRARLAPFEGLRRPEATHSD